MLTPSSALSYPLLCEVLDLGPEAAVEHLGHVYCEALEEAGGVVCVVPEPLLVLPKLVEWKWSYSSWLIDWPLRARVGLFKRAAWGRTSRDCPPCTAAATAVGWQSSLCIFSTSRASPEGMSGVLMGTLRPMSQSGAEHVNTRVAMTKVMRVFCLTN